MSITFWNCLYPLFIPAYPVFRRRYLYMAGIYYSMGTDTFAYAVGNLFGNKLCLN